MSSSTRQLLLPDSHLCNKTSMISTRSLPSPFLCANFEAPPPPRASVWKEQELPYYSFAIVLSWDSASERLTTEYKQKPNTMLAAWTDRKHLPNSPMSFPLYLTKMFTRFHHLATSLNIFFSLRNLCTVNNESFVFLTFSLGVFSSWAISPGPLWFLSHFFSYSFLLPVWFISPNNRV